MTHHRICPVSHARALGGQVWRRIPDAYISPGDTVLDIGCDPGYFTRPMARLAGRAR